MYRSVLTRRWWLKETRGDTQVNWKFSNTFKPVWILLWGLWLTLVNTLGQDNSQNCKYNSSPARVSESPPPFTDNSLPPKRTCHCPDNKASVFICGVVWVLNFNTHMCHYWMWLSAFPAPFPFSFPSDPGGECIPQLHLPLWGTGEARVANIHPQLHDPPWISDWGLWAPYSPHRWHRRGGRRSHQAQLCQPPQCHAHTALANAHPDRTCLSLTKPEQ